MPENKLTSHLTAQTLLSSAIHSWQAYLADKGRSPNTIKAFLSDVRLLTTYLPEDIAVGKISTADLNRYFEWMEKERDELPATTPGYAVLYRSGYRSGCSRD